MAEVSERQRGMELLRSSKRVLLVLSDQDSLDPLAAGVVLGQSLESGSRVVVYLRAAPLPPFFTQVGISPLIVATVETSREYEILVRSQGVGIEELSLHQANGGYSIRLKAKSGQIRPEELVLKELSAPFDLVVLVGLLELPAMLGEALATTPQLLIADRRIITSAAVQLSDESASSLSELTVGIVEGVTGSAGLARELATLLLSGLLAATASFRGPKTTAKSLTVAAQLTAAGADRQLAFSTIIELRSISTLRLWGRLLSRLTYIKASRFAWSYVTREDLIAAAASEVDVPRAIDELLLTIEGTDLVVILLQEAIRIIAFIRRVGGATSARTLADRLQEVEAEISGDEREAYVTINGRLIDRGKEIISKLLGQPVTVEPSSDPNLRIPSE